MSLFETEVDLRPDVTNVLYEVEDHVATITMNDPDHLNPISHGPRGMEDDVATCMRAADADDDVRCVVITGAGRAFSSGGGGGGGRRAETAVDWLEFLDGTYGCNDAIREQRKPVIGAINGLCYGNGFIMALHFDFLVAVDTATFGLIETRFGSTGVDVLPFLVGPMWARFLALTGELITAQKAKEIGLVLDVFPQETFREKVYDLARRIAAMPREAVVLNRRLINKSMAMMGARNAEEYGAVIDALTNSVSHLATSAEGVRFADARQEGWQAFKEARDKAFKVPWLAHEQ